MPPSPVPADPGRDEDLAWLDRDPVTAAECEASWTGSASRTRATARTRTSTRTSSRFTAGELAEIREAAADELLAVKAATTGRRGPGQPGSARVFPGESSSPAAGVRARDALDVLPGCAQLAVAADAAAGEDGRFAGVSEAELVGVMCAWDRVEAHAAARKLAAIAELARRNPGPAGRGVHRAIRSRTRWGSPGPGPDSLIGMAQTLHDPAARHRGGAGRRDDLPVQGRDHRPGHRAAR